MPGYTSTIRTSQAFGNANFQQSFREEQQQQQKQQQQKQQQYQQSIQSQEEEELEDYVEDYELSQASSPRPVYDAYKHNQNRFAISHQDTNPHPPPSAPSTSNFLLHQLRLRFSDNPPQKHPGAHGFTRAVSNHDTKILSFPEKPPPQTSITTPPAVSVVLSKSSTSSVVRSVSSRNQSAIAHIQPQSSFNNSKYFSTSTLKPSSTTAANLSQPLTEDYRPEEEYDDYLEEEIDPDPFYKDVQKLERQRRDIEQQEEEEVSRMRKKYNILLRRIQKNKYHDSKHQEILRGKLIKLAEQIREAEAKLLETTTEVDNTFPTFTPPTPPRFLNRKLSTPPGLFKMFEFTLLSNQSSDLLSDHSENSPDLSSGTPPENTISSSVLSTDVPSSKKDRIVSTVRHFFDLVDISEDIPTAKPPKRKLIQEDYFGTLSSKTESMKDLFQRLKNRMLGPKTQETVSPEQDRVNKENVQLWFTDNSTDYLVANLSQVNCSRNNDLFNEFLPSSETIDLNSTSSSPIQQLVGTRYIKFCRECVKNAGKSIRILFLIETQFLLDIQQYRDKIGTVLKFSDLVNMIDLRSRIKVLQFKRKTKKYKALKVIHTDQNPRSVVDRIMRRLEDKYSG